MCIFYVRQNQLQPPASTQLLFDGTPFVLLPTDVVKFELLEPSTYAPVFSKSANVNNAATGEVEYRWSAGDTATKGLYAAQFVVQRGGNQTVVPSCNYHLVEVF
jgi:hypothetical protein